MDSSSARRECSLSAQTYISVAEAAFYSSSHLTLSLLIDSVLQRCLQKFINRQQQYKRSSASVITTAILLTYILNARDTAAAR
jgi:hypothetical protein